MTLLTSMWKAGKTTLLAHLLARRAAGQQLLGRPVSPGKSVVISEEPRTLWADRCRQFNFGGKLCLFPQPFPHLPSAEEWRGLLQRVAQLQTEHGVDLLVIDSLTHFLRAESVAQGVLDLLMPVRELTSRGMAALLMHHPRRRGAGAGVAGRGHAPSTPKSISPSRCATRATTSTAGPAASSASRATPTRRATSTSS